MLMSPDSSINHRHNHPVVGPQHHATLTVLPTSVLQIAPSSSSASASSSTSSSSAVTAAANSTTIVPIGVGPNSNRTAMMIAGQVPSSTAATVIRVQVQECSQSQSVATSSSSQSFHHTNEHSTNMQQQLHHSQHHHTQPNRNRPMGHYATSSSSGPISAHNAHNSGSSPPTATAYFEHASVSLGRQTAIMRCPRSQSPVHSASTSATASSSTSSTASSSSSSPASSSAALLAIVPQSLNCEAANVSEQHQQNNNRASTTAVIALNSVGSVNAQQQIQQQQQHSRCGIGARSLPPPLIKQEHHHHHQTPQPLQQNQSTALLEQRPQQQQQQVIIHQQQHHQQHQQSGAVAAAAAAVRPETPEYTKSFPVMDTTVASSVKGEPDLNIGMDDPPLRDRAILTQVARRPPPLCVPSCTTELSECTRYYTHISYECWFSFCETETRTGPGQCCNVHSE